jgi:hypothetical protein
MHRETVKNEITVQIFWLNKCWSAKLQIRLLFLAVIWSRWSTICLDNFPIVICVVLLLFVFSMSLVLLYVLFVCKCVLYYCHQLSTQLQLTNISYHDTGNNWTHCVNSKLIFIWKQWCWNCLILLLNSWLTMLLDSLSYVFIVGSNSGYTMFRGSVKSTGYPLHSPDSPSLPLPCVTACHQVSNPLYNILLRRVHITNVAVR